MWSFEIKSHKIISFRIISKITVNHKKMVWLQRDSIIDTFHPNFWDFDKFFWMVVFLICKTIFKVDIKLLILPQLILLWCLYDNLWTLLYPFYILEESEVVARKSSLKKVFLKIPQNSQENICAELSFAIKVEAGGFQLHWIQNLIEVLSFEFWEIFKNIYFVNVYKGLPLNNKIFTRVSFRTILGFYYIF